MGDAAVVTIKWDFNSNRIFFNKKSDPPYLEDRGRFEGSDAFELERLVRDYKSKDPFFRSEHVAWAVKEPKSASLPYDAYFTFYNKFPPILMIDRGNRKFDFGYGSNIKFKDGEIARVDFSTVGSFGNTKHIPYMKEKDWRYRYLPSQKLIRISHHIHGIPKDLEWLGNCTEKAVDEDDKVLFKPEDILKAFQEMDVEQYAIAKYRRKTTILDLVRTVEIYGFMRLNNVFIGTPFYKEFDYGFFPNRGFVRLAEDLSNLKGQFASRNPQLFEADTLLL